MRSLAEPCALAVSAKKLDAGTNAATVVSVSADVEQYWVVDAVVWSYDLAPTGGKLTIAIGGTTFLEVDITAAGPGMLQFEKPVYNSLATKNEALTVTLAAGGSGVTGKLNVRYR